VRSLLCARCCALAAVRSLLCVLRRVHYGSVRSWGRQQLLARLSVIVNAVPCFLWYLGVQEIDR